MEEIQSEGEVSTEDLKSVFILMYLSEPEDAIMKKLIARTTTRTVQEASSWALNAMDLGS